MTGHSPKRVRVDTSEGLGSSHGPTLSAKLRRFANFEPPFESQSNTKAVKSDDAQVPTYLWDDRISFLLNLPMLGQRELWAANLIHKVQLR